jgi:hypothetical protein
LAATARTVQASRLRHVIDRSSVFAVDTDLKR